jgi:hypothetical protein
MASRKRPGSKSVNLGIRVTPDVAKRIRKLRRDRRDNSVGDTCRLLFDLAFVALSERAEFEAHAKALAEPPATPEVPPLPAAESETKVAA